MFSLISGFWKYLFTKPNINILIIGLDNAGKTSILEKIKSKLGNVNGLPMEKIPPTIGMNLAKIIYRGSQVVIWDLGGQIKMRTMWERYYDEANAIIFVVDSADFGRLEESKLAYEAICDHDSVNNIPIIILCNKQDMQGALSPGDLAMNFYAIQDAADRCRVFPVSALTGDGIIQAMHSVIEEAKINANNNVQ
eukprot:gene13348-17904_t